MVYADLAAAYTSRTAGTRAAAPRLPPAAEKLDEWRATIWSLISFTNKDEPRPARPSCWRSVESVHAGGGRTGDAATTVHSPPPCQQPARQLGKSLHGSMQLLGQLVKHLRGGMQIFVKAHSLHQHSNQPASMALHASSVWTRVEARRGGDGRDELCCRPR